MTYADTVGDGYGSEADTYSATRGSSTTEFDTDGDGVVDTLYTDAADGSWTVLADTDRDGIADTLVADADGDGNPDAGIMRTDDGYLVQLDENGDGAHEVSEVVTRDGLDAAAPGLADALDQPVPTQGDAADYSTTDTTSDPTNDSTTVTDPYVEDGRMVGDPTGGSEHWFQQSQNGYCVPASVAQLVSDYTGIDYTDETAFVGLANDMGLFSVGPDGSPGLTVEGSAELLQEAGVPAHLEMGTTEDLVSFLDEGRGVMLFVDSGELWYGEEDSTDQQMDHALLITGIDTERGVAILSDPGHPEGDAVEVPLELVEDAWADSGNTMLVCDQPAPGGGSGAPDPTTTDPSTTDLGTPPSDSTGYDSAYGDPTEVYGDETPTDTGYGTENGWSGSSAEAEAGREDTSVSAVSQIGQTTSLLAALPWVILPTTVDLSGIDVSGLSRG